MFAKSLAVGVAILWIVHPCFAASRKIRGTVIEANESKSTIRVRITEKQTQVLHIKDSSTFTADGKPIHFLDSKNRPATVTYDDKTLVVITAEVGKPIPTKAEKADAQMKRVHDHLAKYIKKDNEIRVAYSMKSKSVDYVSIFLERELKYEGHEDTGDRGYAEGKIESVDFEKQKLAIKQSLSGKVINLTFRPRNEMKIYVDGVDIWQIK